MLRRSKVPPAEIRQFSRPYRSPLFVRRIADGQWKIAVAREKPEIDFAQEDLRENLSL
jgi:hypothetical protein